MAAPLILAIAERRVSGLANLNFESGSTKLTAASAQTVDEYNQQDRQQAKDSFSHCAPPLDLSLLSFVTSLNTQNLKTTYVLVSNPTKWGSFPTIRVFLVCDFEIP